MIDEAVKNRIILIVSILCLIFFFWAVDVTNRLGKQEKNLQDEIRKRLEFEEQNAKFLKEKSALEDNNKQLVLQLADEKKKHEAIKKTLAQEQLVNKSLKEELEKLTRLKETLEEDLKEALVRKSRSRKR